MPRIDRLKEAKEETEVIRNPCPYAQGESHDFKPMEAMVYLIQSDGSHEKIGVGVTCGWSGYAFGKTASCQKSVTNLKKFRNWPENLNGSTWQKIVLEGPWVYAKGGWGWWVTLGTMGFENYNKTGKAARDVTEAERIAHLPAIKEPPLEGPRIDLPPKPKEGHKDAEKRETGPIAAQIAYNQHKAALEVHEDKKKDAYMPESVVFEEAPPVETFDDPF